MMNRIYEVKVNYGQFDTYYVNAADVATAAAAAIARDDAEARAIDVEVDTFRRVSSVREFCDTAQFAGPITTTRT